jgi:hypothetical protein
VDDQRRRVPVPLAALTGASPTANSVTREQCRGITIEQKGQFNAQRNRMVASIQHATSFL